MPIGTAVHERTFALCESLNFREWSGYYAVSAYEAHHEHEYNAIRNAAALIDVSPLYKYLVRGRDAEKLVDRVITRDATKLAVGQVYYTPWCDERGKVIDDGTVTRLSEDTFRWTAADPSLRWLTRNAIGLDVAIDDISEQVAALALQGPTSGRLLDAVADADIRSLKYFRMTSGAIGGIPVDISRTGYTGDLGYEIWMPWDRAIDVWDALVARGRPFDIHPAGMLALDVARVEAGLLLIEVDFNSSKKALRRTHRSRWVSAVSCRRRNAGSSDSTRWPTSSAAGGRGRSSASRSTGRRRRSCTTRSASRRRSRRRHRASRCPSTRAAARSGARRRRRGRRC
jgi:glycine cleavage system T protein (aminomethyltransferase)